MGREINLCEEEVESVSFDDDLTPVREDESVEREEGEEKRRGDLVRVKRLVEALLFASNEPLSFTKIREVTDQLVPLKPRELKEILLQLQNEYLSEERGFRLEEIGQGYLLRTCEEFSSYIELLYRNKRTEKLTQASAEVLAIIAYKQPITRPQIEAIRGVDSSGIVASLVERGLIHGVGKLEAPGRPTLYGITKEFLSHFGLKDIQELPAIDSGDEEPREDG